MHIFRTLASAALLSLGSTASAQVVTMATGAPGSLAYNAGQAVAVVANHSGITVRTQPLVGYMPLLQGAEIDFGYANGAEAVFAYTGTGNFDRAHPNVRLVGEMFQLTTGIMAPCDLGLQSVDDLAGRSDLRIASEYTSSSIIPFYIRGVLATGGLDYRDFESVPVSNFVSGIRALGDERVDLALVSLNASAGQEAAVRLKARGGLCYVSARIGAEAEAALAEVLPSGLIAPLPRIEGLNGLQSWDAALVRVPWMLLTNADVSDDLVYDLTRVVHRNKDALGIAFGAFNRANFEAMAPESTTPYHPGAIRYFKEAGVPVAD
ncbi:TAXI family TRAP transporter solute-binding subunit [Poseidonocella sedimentorum]|uniref:TRAP transporter solute receptor, TAXI family n=1 Tax=Poseidonocella sedimentorum TaxID=871652 RepID=A0A1I6E463_9RHOB|nr:TAXI family TRAP transporter solute-binding subunit [Poseidonocella sedimentorum]SFR12564.1 TRAP transporter solute receptor, TAXI family [Poseidonocella sedimentorum]